MGLECAWESSQEHAMVPGDVTDDWRRAMAVWEC